MTKKLTADNNSDPLTGIGPGGLIDTLPLQAVYNSARDREKQGARPDDPTFKPLEFEAVSLWEDLYHHVLLKGYSNNSQIPSREYMTDACDIVSRYYDFETQRRTTFLFTEVKRASRREVKTGILDLEVQVLGYCRLFFTGAQRNRVFACTIVGEKIRCMEARVPTGKGRDEARLYDLRDGKQVDSKKSVIGDYLDPHNDEQAREILGHFETITSGLPRPYPTPVPPAVRGSIASSPPDLPAGPASSSQELPPPARLSDAGTPSSSSGSDRPGRPPAPSASLRNDARTPSPRPSAPGSRYSQGRGASTSAAPAGAMPIRSRNIGSPDSDRSGSPKSTPPERRDRQRSP